MIVRLEQIDSAVHETATAQKLVSYTTQAEATHQAM